MISRWRAAASMTFTLVALANGCSNDSSGGGATTAAVTVVDSVAETAPPTTDTEPAQTVATTVERTTTTLAPATADELTGIATDYFIALFAHDTDGAVSASGAELAAAAHHDAYSVRLPDAAERVAPPAAVTVTGELAIETQTPESITTTGSLVVEGAFEATNLVFAPVGGMIKLVDYQRAGEYETEAVRNLAVAPNQFKVFSGTTPAQIRGVTGGSLVSGQITVDNGLRHVEYLVSIFTENELPIDSATFTTTDGIDVELQSLTGRLLDDGSQTMLVEYTGEQVPDYGGTFTLFIGAADVVFKVPPFTTWDEEQIVAHPMSGTVATTTATASPSTASTTASSTASSVGPTASAVVTGPGTVSGVIVDSAAFARQLAIVMLANVDTETLGGQIAFEFAGLSANVGPDQPATPTAVSTTPIALTAADGETAMPIAIVDSAGRCTLLVVAGLGFNNFAFTGPGNASRCLGVAAFEAYEDGVLVPLDI